jgi:thiamine kinase
MASNAKACDRALAARLCADFREWAPHEPAAPVLRGALSGGLSNCSLLLEGAMSSYVLRIGNQHPPPGVDRRRELRLAGAAAEHGLAPPLLFCDPDRGLMITRYVGEAETQTTSLEALPALLRAIHTLPSSGERLDSPAQLEHWRELLTSDSATGQLLDNNEPCLARSIQCIRSSTRAPVTCHNDLLTANRRLWEGKLIALDWEYAAAGDPFFDLAVCTAELTSEQSAKELLWGYLQRQPNAVEEAGFAAQRTVAAAIASCWYERQQPDAILALTARRQLQILLDDPDIDGALSWVNSHE